MSPELVRDLELLRAELEWPAERDLTDGVLARLAAGEADASGEPAAKRKRTARAALGAPGRRRWPRRRTLAWLAAALLLGGGGTVAAVPDARSSVLEWLGLKSVRIERLAPQPGLGTRLHLGEETTLARARERVGFRLLVPTALTGRRVYVDPDAPARGAVSFTGTGGVVLTEYEASVTPMIGKAIQPGTTITRLTVDGHPAYYLTGKPHQFGYLDADGRFAMETLRLAGDTLLLERDDLLIRVEGARDRAAAIALVKSLR